eukprot:5755942-Lingulodinium_polyedra.AAC.1
MPLGQVEQRDPHGSGRQRVPRPVLRRVHSGQGGPPGLLLLACIRIAGSCGAACQGGLGRF